MMQDVLAVGVVIGMLAGGLGLSDDFSAAPGNASEHKVFSFLGDAPGDVPAVMQPSEIVPPVPEAHQPAKVRVTIDPVKLESDLYIREYSGFKITLTNLGSDPVTVDKVDVENAVSGKKAYQDVKRSLVSAGSLLGVSGLLGTTISRSSMNVKAKNEADAFGNNLAATVIPPGGSVSTQYLVAFGKVPKVHVHFADDADVKLQYVGYLYVQPEDNVEFQNVNYKNDRLYWQSQVDSKTPEAKPE